MENYHLSPVDGRWILAGAHEDSPLAQYTTKAEALLHSSQFVRKEGGSLMIHKRDGSIEEERSFPRGRDLRHLAG